MIEVDFLNKRIQIFRQVAGACPSPPHMTKEQALAYCRKHVVFQMLPWLGKVENDLSFELIKVAPQNDYAAGHWEKPAEGCGESSQAAKHDFGPSVKCADGPNVSRQSSFTIHEAVETNPTLFRLQILTSSPSQATCSTDSAKYDEECVFHTLIPNKGDKHCPFVDKETVCSKTSPSMSNLTIHLKSHVDIREHKCMHCSRSFKLKSHLKQHSLVHTKLESRHFCQISSCKRAFKRLSAARDHYESHHLNKARYRCSFPGCNRSYQGKSNLVIHQRKHTGERPFLCVKCQKSFSSKGNLKKHLKRHLKWQRDGQDVIKNEASRDDLQDLEKCLRDGNRLETQDQDMQHSEQFAPACQKCHEFDEDSVFDQINRSFGSHLSDPVDKSRKASKKVEESQLSAYRGLQPKCKSHKVQSLAFETQEPYRADQQLLEDAPKCEIDSCCTSLMNDVSPVYLKDQSVQDLGSLGLFAGVEAEWLTPQPKTTCQHNNELAKRLGPEESQVWPGFFGQKLDFTMQTPQLPSALNMPLKEEDELDKYFANAF